MPLSTGTYRHYKGGDYTVHGTALHTETREEMVIYTPQYRIPDLPKDITFVRPLAQFTAMVELDGKMVRRFEYVDDTE